MNLKDFLASRDSPPELFWSLVIEKGWVQAGIWYIGATAAEVLSVSPGAAWEVEEELVSAADAALSSAVQKLPEEYPEPNKTVFGVPSSWVKGGEISEEYLAKIKKLCTELSLNPVGFVVLPEAIAHLYKSEEGAPVSAIVLGLGKEALELSVFKLGALVGSTTVARSVSLIEDVTEGLSRFEGASPLPSRFIVYDGKGGELEEAKETLMQNSWEETTKFKFLHTPKAETLNSDRKVLATSLAGANEIGDVTHVTSTEEEKETETEKIVEEEVVNVAPPQEDITPQDLGFAIGEDVTLNNKRPEMGNAQFVPVNNPPVQHVPQAIPVIHRPNINPAPKVNEYLKKTTSLFHGFSGKFFPKSATTGRGNKNFVYGFLVLLLLAVIGGGFYWWFVPKAKVTIYVTPKSYQQETTMTFSTSGQSDPGTGVIPAQALTSVVSGNKTKAASGSKLVGDKAKGTVQIANGNSSDLELSAGTVIVSSSGLKFITNKDASISAQAIPGSPGTASVDVISADIGAQYNLAKGEVFKVGNYSKSLVAATSTADFSGGSSQQISAVSKDDQTALENQLKDELTGNAKTDLSAKVTDAQVFLEDLAGTEITSENFDHKVGDQADSVKLALSLNVTGIAADKNKLLEYTRAALKDKIPSGFVLRDSQITFKFTFVSLKDGNAVYKVAIGANFLPETNTDAIVKQIAGKTVSVAENYLTSVPGFTRANVSIDPHLPGPLGTLPRVNKNITVEVVAER